MLDVGDRDVVLGLGRVAVGEVDVRAVEPVEQRATRRRGDEGVPAHVRHAPRAQPAHGARAGGRARAALLALLEQELQADADAEQRARRGRALAQRLRDRLEPARRARDVADAGDHGERRLAHDAPDPC